MNAQALALNLEVATVVWMVIEAAVSFAAGLAAGSIALITFGMDSVIELVSASVLLWRLYVEWRGASADRIQRAERSASAVVGWGLYLLAAYVIASVGHDLWSRSAPEATPVGVGLATAAVLIMPALSHAKRRVAQAMGSAALRGDAACGVVCAYMAATLLAGLALRMLVGWWWADPVAALALVPFIAHEGRQALAAARGRPEGCCRA